MISLGITVKGQWVTKQIVIVNGGAYSNPGDYVTVFVYDPIEQTTELAGTIYTQSVQDVLVHNGFAFVAAQDSIVKFNLDTYEKLESVAISGANKLGIYENKLIVSRQYPETSNFVQILNSDNLGLLASIAEVSDESAEVLVVGDTAYVSVPGGWASTIGKLAVIDIKNNQFVREINMGEEAVGIGPLFKDGENLYIINKTPYMATSGSVTVYNFNSGVFTIHSFNHVIGKGAGLFNGLLYLMINGNIGSVDVMVMEIADEVLIEDIYSDFDITACLLDIIDEKIYVNYSFWTAPDGFGLIYDLSGQQTGEYEVGISAEAIAADYRDVTYVPPATSDMPKINVFPNPCSDHIVILANGLGQIENVEIFGTGGCKVMEKTICGTGNVKMELSGIKKRMYFLRVRIEGKYFIRKIIKK